MFIYFLCNIFIYTFIYRLYAEIKSLVLWLNPLKRTRNHCILGQLILDFFVTIIIFNKYESQRRSFIKSAHVPVAQIYSSE